jgi:putative transposase
VAVTEHPTAAWTAQQLRNAFSETEAPRYLLHDRDSVFADVVPTLAGMNIRRLFGRRRDRPGRTRAIGSIRRECLDHVIVMNSAGLRRLLRDYVSYYMGSRTHLVLDKDTPCSRPVTSPTVGRIVAIPEVGGPDHRYDRSAA